MNKNAKYTSTDVAKLAGVSQATVSRVFNQPDSVIERTREKVLNAARQLGYYPNAIAKSLNSSKTNLVGVIVRDITNPYYSAFIAALMERLTAEGKKVLLFNGTQTCDIETMMTEAISFRVDGLIIASASLCEQLMTKDIPDIVPLVLVNYQVRSERFCSIGGDEVENGRLVADCLWNHGCRHFYYLTGPENMPSSTERLAGYQQRLKELGVETLVCSFDSYTYESGFSRMQKYIPDLPEENCGIFCGNDLIGIGVLDALKQVNISAPRCRVIGFDNIEESSWSGNQLSSVRFPVEQMINVAMKYLLSNRTEANGCHRFLCEIVERKSTLG